MFKRPLLIVPIFLLIIATILLLFVNLCGAATGPLLERLYWSRVVLESRTVAWTNFRQCDLRADKLICELSRQAAYPYTGLSFVNEFVTDRDTFYYLTRVSYGLLLAGLLFTVISLVAIIISCICTVRIGSVFSSFFVGFTFVLTIGGAACVTAAHVKGVDAFSNDGYSAQIGVKMFAFVWSAVACHLLSLITLGSLARDSRIKIRRDRMSAPPPQQVTYA